MGIMWSEEGRILSGEQAEPKRTRGPRKSTSQGRSNANLSSVQDFTQPTEHTEGIWCRTCNTKYTGSLSEHAAGH